MRPRAEESTLHLTGADPHAAGLIRREILINAAITIIVKPVTQLRRGASTGAAQR